MKLGESLLSTVSFFVLAFGLWFVNRARPGVWRTGDLGTELHLSADGQVLIALEPTLSKLEIWDVRADGLRSSIGQIQHVEFISIAADGSQMILRRRDPMKGTSHCEVWDINRNPPRQMWRVQEKENVPVFSAICVSKVWKLLLPDAVETRDMRGDWVSRPALHFPDDIKPDSHAYGALSHNGDRVFIVASVPEQLCSGLIFDASNGRLLHRFPNFPTGTVADFSPDARFISLTYPEDDNTSAFIWDAHTGRCLRDTYKGDHLDTNVWSPDGKALLDRDGKFYLIANNKPSPFQVAWPRIEGLSFYRAQLSSDGKIWAIPDNRGNVLIGQEG